MKKQCKKVMFLLRLVFFICRVLRLNAVKNMDYVSEGKGKVKTVINLDNNLEHL